MVLAIYDNNPKAFSEDNVNTLIKNKNLKIPSMSYFEDRTHLEARKILRSHNNEWKNISNKIRKASKPKKIKKLKVVNNKNVEKIKQLEKELLEAKLKLDEISKLNIESNNNLNRIEDVNINGTTKTSKENKISNEEVNLSKEEVTEKLTKNEMEEKDEGVFISSISDIEDAEIEEIKIEGQDKNGLETIHFLLLVLFLTLLFGLFVVISRRKANERNQQLSSFSDEIGSQKENQSVGDNNQSLSPKSQDTELKQAFTDDFSKEQSNPDGKKNYLPIADDEDEKKL